MFLFYKMWYNIPVNMVKHLMNRRVENIMRLITLFFILNATILLLHEIESSYEREWEILHLPGKITGFLLLHIPIILILFYGTLEIQRQSRVGLLLGMVTGIGGLIPFMVHKIFVVRKD